MYRFALIGHPLSHSISPFIHKELFKINDIDASYELIDIKESELKNKMQELNALDGYNVTIPYKIEITKLIDKLSRNSFLSNSVNNVKNLDGVSFGYTTDAEAFSIICELSDFDLEKDIVILGCGGVARAIALACIGNKAKSVTLAIRKESEAKCKKLIDEFEARLDYKMEMCDINNINRNIDLLVNATPVGMYPNIDSCPIDDDTIKKSSKIFDTIYNPQETLLFKKGQEYNIPTINGIEMLVFQAALSHNAWFNISYSYEQLEKIIYKARKEIERMYG